MNKHWKYLIYILRHKWYVGVACWKKGLYLQSFTHDLSKFRPDEWIPYANYFYGKNADVWENKKKNQGYYKPTDTGDRAFDFAWLLHQKRNPHHWQWWILPEDNGGVKILPMSDRTRLEMLCDWWGASMAQGYKGKSKTWYERNKDKMQLHPETRKWIEDNVSDEFLSMSRNGNCNWNGKE